MAKNISELDYFDWLLLKDKPITLYFYKDKESFFYHKADKYILEELSDDETVLPEGFEKFQRGSPSIGRSLGIVEIHLVENYYMVLIRTEKAILFLDIGDLNE